MGELNYFLASRVYKDDMSDDRFRIMKRLYVAKEGLRPNAFYFDLELHTYQEEYGEGLISPPIPTIAIRPSRSEIGTVLLNGAKETNLSNVFSLENQYGHFTFFHLPRKEAIEALMFFVDPALRMVALKSLRAGLQQYLRSSTPRRGDEVSAEFSRSIREAAPSRGSGTRISNRMVNDILSSDDRNVREALLRALATGGSAPTIDETIFNMRSAAGREMTQADHPIGSPSEQSPAPVSSPSRGHITFTRTTSRREVTSTEQYPSFDDLANLFGD